MDAFLSYLQTLWLGAAGPGSAAISGAVAKGAQSMDMAQLLALAAALGWASGLRLSTSHRITVWSRLAEARRQDPRAPGAGGA